VATSEESKPVGREPEQAKCSGELAVSLDLLERELGEAVLAERVQGPRRAEVRLARDRHLQALKALRAAFPELRLSAITGTDLGQELELLYHLRVGGSILTLRTGVPKEEPMVATITGLVPGADLHEREVYDMLGITFEGHPNLKRLLLPDDAPESFHPLRKEVEARTIRPVETSPVLQPVITAESGRYLTLVIGPQHPALHEPERFVFLVEGEVVVDVDIRIGYAHRGIEEAAERRDYIHNIYLCERVCGICNVAHSMCFCSAVEELLGLEVPARARYLRVVAAELNRLHSHMLLLGVAAEEMGFSTLFMYIWRDREAVMDLMEMLTGNRVISSFNRIGGVSRDMTPELARKMRSRLPELKERLEHYLEVFTTDPTILARTEKVGLLSRQKAIDYCAAGPTLRASGVDFDVRRDDPYAAYEELSAMRVVVRPEGDNLARYVARLEECLVSVDLIDEALEKLPDGPVRVKAPRRVPPDEVIYTVEAPRGELLYYVRSDGTTRPARVKIRTPTFTNLAALREMLRGAYLADVPVTLASIDPCFSCTDRVVVVDVRDGTARACGLWELARGRPPAREGA